MTENGSQEPTYNLKVVVQQTGLKPDTLRAWERRYGMPQPGRTEGGHRLYSDHDISVLKWLLARQEDGLSISRAVKLWRSLEENGQDPFLEHPLEEVEEVAVGPYVAPDAGDALNEMRHQWIEACMNFDERKAEAVVQQALAYYQPEMVCFELLQKALAEIGSRWYAGTTTVQQEHFASALAVRRLDAMLAATPAPTRSERIVVACAPEDDHTFSPLMISLLLRRQGYDVVYLGAKVPSARLEGTVVQTKPQLVIFSAQLLQTAANLLEVAHLMQAEGTMLAYGGLVFNLIPSLRDRIPAHFLGERLENIPTRVQELLATPRPGPQVEPLTEEYQHAYSYFSERSSLIEAEVWQTLSETGMSHRDLSQANGYMTRNIQSALILGNIEYIGTDLNWVEGLMVNYGIPVEQLRQFVEIYYQAAQTHLTAEPGQIVIHWLYHMLETAD